MPTIRLTSREVSACTHTRGVCPRAGLHCRGDTDVLTIFRFHRDSTSTCGAPPTQSTVSFVPTTTTATPSEGTSECPALTYSHQRSPAPTTSSNERTNERTNSHKHDLDKIKITKQRTNEQCNEPTNERTNSAKKAKSGAEKISLFYALFVLNCIAYMIMITNSLERTVWVLLYYKTFHRVYSIVFNC